MNEGAQKLEVNFKATKAAAGTGAEEYGVDKIKVLEGLDAADVGDDHDSNRNPSSVAAHGDPCVAGRQASGRACQA